MLKKQFLKMALILCIGFGVFFSVFSIVFYPGDWIRASMIFFMAVFWSALAIPEIEPNSVHKPILFQSIVGTIGGALAAIAFDASGIYILLVAVVGAFLGFTARFWVKYIQIP